MVKTGFSLLLPIEDPLKRRFYEVECIKGTWSVRELKRQIDTLYFERSGISQKPEKLSEVVQTKSEKSVIQDIIKSPFTFEFLGLKTKDVAYESDDNPPVGILLVTNRNRAVVEYVVADSDHELFVSKYLVELPDKKDLERFVNQEHAKMK